MGPPATLSSSLAEVRFASLVAAILEKKHGCFDAEPHDIHVISGETDLDEVCKLIEAKQ